MAAAACEGGGAWASGCGAGAIVGDGSAVVGEGVVTVLFLINKHSSSNILART